MRFLPVLTLLSAACGAGEATVGGLHGVALPTAVPRPAFTLLTPEGRTYDFQTATRGRLTLLFFGYTSCPDVCPATMANLGAVLARTTSTERGAIDVVFVTTDPARDTPDRLRAWLGRFDRDFIGLTGTAEQVEAAQRAAGVATAVRGPGADYSVSHAAQVLVYSPDDSGHVAYPFGTRQSEWADDLPKLLDRWTGARP